MAEEETEPAEAPEQIPEATAKPGGMFRDLLEGSFPELYEEPKPEPEAGEGEGEDGGDGDGAPPPEGDPPAEGEEGAEPEVDEYQERIDAIRTQVRPITRVNPHPTSPAVRRAGQTERSSRTHPSRTDTDPPSTAHPPTF